MKRSFPIISCLFLVGSGLVLCAPKVAGQIVMEGPFSYSQTGRNLNLRAERIINRGSVGNSSGTQQLQLWATPSFYIGSPLAGYKLGEVSFGHLRNGRSHEPINRNTTYYAPPEGRYNIVLVLSEHRGGVGGGYQPASWHNFGEVDVGPGLALPPPPENPPSPPPLLPPQEQPRTDFEPPAVVITSPAGRVFTKQTRFTLRGTASDNVGPYSLEYRVRSPQGILGNWQAGRLSDNGTRRPWSQLISLGVSGTWRVDVRVEDAAGNRSPVVSRQIVVDRRRPVVTVTTPAGSRVSTGKRSFTLRGMAQDNISATQIEVRVRPPKGRYGKWERSKLPGGGKKKTWRRLIGLNRPGAWLVEIRARDQAGNLSVVRKVTITRR